MKLASSKALWTLAALAVPLAGSAQTITKTTTKNLRGNIVHTRTVYVDHRSDVRNGNPRLPQSNHDHQRPHLSVHLHEDSIHAHSNLRQPEPLVDPHPTLKQQHQQQRVRQSNRHHQAQNDANGGEHMHRIRTTHIHTQRHSETQNHPSPPQHPHRNDMDLLPNHPDVRGIHFVGHDIVRKDEQHHYRPRHQQNETEYHNQQQQHTHSDHGNWQSNRSMYTLPTGQSYHYNESLFEELHDGPYRVYAEAMGHDLDDDESFPVFALPQWRNSTGVFTGFSKHAEPLIFENVQFLLHWHDIVAATSSPVTQDLLDHIANNNFHASLIIGKAIGNGANVPFIGMVICYYQFGASKSVLVPFSKLEDFFDDTSERRLLDPKTKSLEMTALHAILQEKREHHPLYHPALAHSEERRVQLEDLEVIHFQKLFQLLIRRSFLFSFGFADCLMNEPHELRSCLDDTFYHLIEMETMTRGALDDQIVERLAEINQTFHNKISEACVSVQGNGNGMMYGTGPCHTTDNLGLFSGNYYHATF